jgi:hypothetical protein
MGFDHGFTAHMDTLGRFAESLRGGRVFPQSESFCRCAFVTACFSRKGAKNAKILQQKQYSAFPRDDPARAKTETQKRDTADTTR